MKIIQRREINVETAYSRVFDWSNEVNAGFSFDCDKDGVVDEAALCEPARENFRACLTGVVDGRKVIDRSVVSWKVTTKTPAIGLCDCGAQVELEGFTCTCTECGADYNSSGQRLGPREQWGEETGESLVDILRIP